MKIKKEYCILGAVILTLTLYLILHNPDRTHYTLPEMSRTSKGKISKIEISKSDGSIILEKKDKGWQIFPHGYPADTDKVKTMLDIIEKLTLTALVSESRNYNMYDLHNDKKITVRVWAGDVLDRELDVGKAAASYRHTFIRIAGDDGVYHAQGNFRGKFDFTMEKLRDKVVFLFDKTEIKEIRITKDKQSMLFTRKQVPIEVSADEKTDVADSPSPELETPSPELETIWQSDDGHEVDEYGIERLLTTLSNLRCESYLDNRKKSDFTHPICTLHVKDTQEHTLSIFAKKGKEDENYPAISSMNNYPFMLSDQKANSIMKSL